MRLFAAVRDPREYRRGMVLGLTLAETMLLLLFLLLMALGALLWRREAELAEARELLEHERQRSYELRTALDVLAPAVKQLRHSGAGMVTMEQLVARLVEAERMPQRDRELASALAEARAEIAQARGQQQALAARLAEAERQRAELAARLAEAERQRAELAARLAAEREERRRAEQAFAELAERIRRGGSLYPPCGPDEFSFRVTILDGGRAIVQDLSTPAGRAHEAWALIRPFPRDVPIALAQFLEATRAFAAWGQARQPECRFGVRVQDGTSAANKDGYKAAMGSLGSPPAFRPFWRVGG